LLTNKKLTIPKPIYNRDALTQEIRIKITNNKKDIKKINKEKNKPEKIKNRPHPNQNTPTYKPAHHHTHIKTPKPPPKHILPPKTQTQEIKD
ncbi:hypothetical protein ACQWF9_25000, partial [Salmonella enterica subsp. enterica serovar Infantis]